MWIYVFDVGMYVHGNGPEGTCVAVPGALRPLGRERTHTNNSRMNQAFPRDGTGG